jgi:hypothetical protein
MKKFFLQKTITRQKKLSFICTTWFYNIKVQSKVSVLFSIERILKKQIVKKKF